MGAAVQFRMLAVSGLDTGTTVGGLAAFSLLGVGGLLALPRFAPPVIFVGGPTTSRALVNAAILGAVGFVLFAGFGALVLATTPRCAGPAGSSSGSATSCCASARRCGTWTRPWSSSAPYSRRVGHAVVAGRAALGRTPRPRLPVLAGRAARHG